MTPAEAETRLAELRALAERALRETLPDAEREPRRLHQAMHYAVTGPGKRIRPVLCYATGLALGLDPETLHGPACALEFIHAYSLVHDDLPAMDDDDLRRGRPTCHRAFDEATAILAGDALQALAFEVLVERLPPAWSARAGRLVALLARAAGHAGMAGGQALDLEAEGTTPDIDALRTIHRLKTGALLEAAVRLPVALAEPEPAVAAALADYAAAVGLAFQIQDDILDETGDTAVLGKRQGADAALGKATYPRLLGLAGARAELAAAHRRALAALEAARGADVGLLRHIADRVVDRDR
ncbi:MAG: (2E,6E)-farnesyl diphosphate synthase [Gammaproteobacteria bacterium]|nr:MAG: (2E,6E)-farnesyl diphosphate synthase [Gammaproteobacteria bacterium]